MQNSSGGEPTGVNYIKLDGRFFKRAQRSVEVFAYNSNIDRSLPIAKSLGVRWLLSYLDNKISFEEAVRLSKRDTRRYVKRQITWFTHNYIPYKNIFMK